MKEYLRRKYLGIPVAVLLLLILAGIAYAWYSFATISSTTDVQESLSATETAEFSETMHPGDTNTWTFEIANSADVDYDVKADLTYNAPSGVTITSFTVGKSDETDDLTDDNSAEFSIKAAKKAANTISCSLIISAAKDATPGDVTVSLDLSRA